MSNLPLTLASSYPVLQVLRMISSKPIRLVTSWLRAIALFGLEQSDPYRILVVRHLPQPAVSMETIEKR